MSVSFSFRINYTLDDFGDIMDSFGYDQGMMSGVNISPDYVRRMKIGDATWVLYIIFVFMANQ